MLKLHIQIIVSLFIVNLLLAQSSALEPKILKYKIGINNNLIVGSSDFRSGYTGIGIFVEPFLTQKLSVLLSFNSFDISAKNAGYTKIDSKQLTTNEIYLLFRYRLNENQVTVYPELGMGSWGGHASYLTTGFGMDLFITNRIIISTELDYLTVFDRLFDVGGGGWTSGNIKLNFNIAYGLYVTKKKI